MSATIKILYGEREAHDHALRQQHLYDVRQRLVAEVEELMTPDGISAPRKTLKKRAPRMNSLFVVLDSVSASDLPESSTVSWRVLCFSEAAFLLFFLRYTMFLPSEKILFKVQ